MAATRRQFTTATEANADDIRRPLSILLTGIAVGSFVLTLPAPFFRMQPRLGSTVLEQIVTYTTGESFQVQTYSLLGGIRRLWVDGQSGLAAVLFLFSVLFPVIKLTGLVLQTGQLLPTTSSTVVWLSRLGKWSMLDVLVLALVVVAFKAFPGGTRIELCWGTWTFALSVIAGMAASQLMSGAKDRVSFSRPPQNPPEIPSSN